MTISKKQRMLQGEIEKTIKSFPQIEDARVHITNGKESVFAQEAEPGSAAVSLTIKPGESLDITQVRSIISLVSASSFNVPKQNIEVVDQYMNLLSDGLYDENGKEIKVNDKLTPSQCLYVIEGKKRTKAIGINRKEKNPNRVKNTNQIAK